MTTFPNREHEQADKAARRRARTALNAITEDVAIMHRKLDLDSPMLDEDDTRALAEHVRARPGHLGRLAALRDVRAWHAADLADAAQAESEGRS